MAFVNFAPINFCSDAKVKLKLTLLIGSPLIAVMLRPLRSSVIENPPLDSNFDDKFFLSDDEEFVFLYDDFLSYDNDDKLFVPPPKHRKRLSVKEL